ncbi:MAG TPA: sigma 54-interacting transcriptional regulator [Planctomycetota bacterium]
MSADELEHRLLAAATGLAGVQRVPELVARLRPALALAPEPCLAGLALLDEERGRVALHLARADGAGPELVELRADEVRTLRAPDGNGAAFARVLEASPPDAWTAELARRGARALSAAPLAFARRDLGLLFLGERAAEAAAPARLAYLERLARIVEPHVFGCATDERFARGDRRRDALRELSRVINSSLETRVVLHLARTAVAGVAGHRASWIGLLEPDGERWRRHEGPAPADGAGEPAPQPVAGSVVAELLATGRTLESDDLTRQQAFRDDAELRALGVRRYVATPLRAGGKTIGAFLFGTDDPHPPLRVDVWLVENMALQIALAIHNAQHYEEIQRLSARRERENVYLREELASEHEAQGMLGASPALETVRARIQRVAATDATVLVSGPTGVGKELVARAIHAASPRRAQPLVKLNCAAIPEGMVESELFGHERGAFTSAVERRIGRFELASDGTLFLDEVGELPLAVQAKLLRVLQSGEFERVGGTKTLTTNARIVAATNRDLARAVSSGAFRADLYYRLDVFPIEVPSLEARRADIPVLAQAFLEGFARRMGKRIEGLAPSALEHLCRRAWPGNVRELKHVIERAVILCDGPLLTLGEEAPSVVVPSTPSARAPELATLEELEAHHIRATLARCAGVIEGPRGAAAALGLKASTLRFRMKRLGIRR